MGCRSKALPHPDGPRRGLEGGFQGSLWCLERSFEAIYLSKGHFRVRWSPGTICFGMRIR
ncbi:hypothetical protein FPV16_01710 [Methylobacterium sp. W2]|nr:hypothetical protein [Methylobacterium sp. W2]